MRSLIFAGALAAVVGASAGAQGPVAGDGRNAPGAELLLARTGELGLTDAQVTRLAAIARRAAARRQAMRATRDSLRTRLGQGARPDSATRRQLITRVRTDMERMRDQDRTDRRDAIAVLTADQQARAWELVANRAGHGARGARGARGGMRPGGLGRGGMRRSPGRESEGGMRRPMRDRGEMRRPI
jgi:Spy/CpxP family protein refolding chaperone